MKLFIQDTQITTIRAVPTISYCVDFKVKRHSDWLKKRKKEKSMWDCPKTLVFKDWPFDDHYRLCGWCRTFLKEITLRGRNQDQNGSCHWVLFSTEQNVETGVENLQNKGPSREDLFIFWWFSLVLPPVDAAVFRDLISGGLSGTVAPLLYN